MNSGFGEEKQLELAENNRRALPGLRLLAISGGLMLLGYLALFFLLQSVSMGYPSLVPHQWPEVFGALRDLFPAAWRDADRTSPLGLLNAVLYLLVIAWLFGVYLFTLRRAFRPGAFAGVAGAAAFRRLFLFAFAALFVLMFVWQMLSTDLYNYIWAGRILGIHGDNPYVKAALDYAAYDSTGWLKWGIWQELPTLYGPLWAVFAAIIAVVAQVGEGAIVYHLIGHRLLASLTHLLCIWLVWRVSGPLIERLWPPAVDAQDSPSGSDLNKGRRIAITLSFAWNPLLLIEFGASGHNDAPILAFVLIAIWLHLKGSWRLAVFALAMAGLVKYAAILFVPAYILMLFWEKWREGTRLGLLQGARRVGEATVIVALVWVSIHAPFWEDAAPVHAFSAHPASYTYNHSIGKMIVAKSNEWVSALATSLGAQPEGEWDAMSLRARFDPYTRWGLRALAALLILLATLRARSLSALFTAWGWTLFAFLTVGAIWFWPWYVSWLIVPVVLAGPSRLWTATQILCASSLTTYAFFPRLMPPFTELATLTGLFNMAPPLLYLLWAYTIRDRRARPAPAVANVG